MEALTQLLRSTGRLDTDAQMSNEAIVAQIQALAAPDNPTDRKTLADLQEQLCKRNGGLVYTIAVKYNRGHQLTEDERSELSLAVLDAARRYDPAHGATFATYLSYHVRSALQREHAFTNDHSQSKYARAARILNNPENYDPDQVRRAEAFQRSKKSFSEETVIADPEKQASAEDLWFATNEQNQDDAETERRLALVWEVIPDLSEEEYAVFLSMLKPQRAVTEYGLRTTAAVAKDLDMDELSVEVICQRIFALIQDHILERDPSLASPEWTTKPRGIQLPGAEGFILGLFGMPTAGEIDNYAKRIGGIRVRRSGNDPWPSRHRPATDPHEAIAAKEAKEQEEELPLFADLSPDHTEAEPRVETGRAETAETRETVCKNAGYGLALGRMR